MSFLILSIGDGVMTRTLQSELIKKGFVKKPRKELPNEQTSNIPKKSKLSRREIEELMGIRRPRYHRVKGSYRSH